MDRPNVTEPGVTILKGDARDLDLPDGSVDLVVTSPPYFSLRSYQDGGEHYAEQIGAEATPAEFVDALVDCTREWMRVVKPSGSIWVNLGDKYASTSTPGPQSSSTTMTGGTHKGVSNITQRKLGTDGVKQKSLIGIPWRYAIRCIDELGLILRAEVIWSKPNGLPESVTDRVRRSHEQWFHFTLEPRYYSAVDEVREAHQHPHVTHTGPRSGRGEVDGNAQHLRMGLSPLGKLPGSVWTIATEPLNVPDHLGVDHFAAFPTEWPRRIITGWSPRGVCVECGEGRRPVVDGERTPRPTSGPLRGGANRTVRDGHPGTNGDAGNMMTLRTITGEACDCPEPTAPTTPGVVLDPFGGTGTTALVASVLGRHGISNDMSSDYNRIAAWRTTDPKQRAKAARREFKPPAEQVAGQVELFDLGEETA